MIYPYKLYMSKSLEKTYHMVPVIVGGYRECMSLSGLENRLLNIGYQCLHKYKTYKVYDCLPRSQHQISREIEEEKDKRLRLFTYDDSKEYPIHEYFKMIGYDYKTKKINGLTIKQHVRNFIKNG